MTADRDQVLAQLATMLREVIGEDWAEEVHIGLETSFSGDLELESIELVALAERLQETYGQSVDFAGWVAGKELGEIIDLRVGQVVEFILSCLSSTQTV